MRNEADIDARAKMYGMHHSNKQKLIAHLKREQVRVQSLSNQNLFEEYSQLLPGDDYDGCFTHEGTVTMALLTDEIEGRLESWLNFKG